MIYDTILSEQSEAYAWIDRWVKAYFTVGWALSVTTYLMAHHISRTAPSCLNVYNQSLLDRLLRWHLRHVFLALGVCL